MTRAEHDRYAVAANRVLRWCSLYTSGLPAAVADERREELLSDLYEQREEAGSDRESQSALARSIQKRALMAPSS